MGESSDLNILHPTAGREALSRESIQHVANVVTLIEAQASKDLSETRAADENQQFQQYILSHDQTLLAKNVTVSVLPSRDEVALGDAKDYEPSKTKHFYAGRDPTILQKFSSEQANLLHISQANPRRNLQLRYLKEISKIDEVPETTIVERIPEGELTLDEVMLLIRLRAVLIDDYFMPNVDLALATISHGVAFHVEMKGDILHIAITRDMPPLRIVVETYRSRAKYFTALWSTSSVSTSIRISATMFLLPLNKAAMRCIAG